MSLVRKQVYLDEAQSRRVKRWAEAEGVPEAEIIRRSLDLGLDRLAADRASASQGAAADFLAGIDELIAAGPVQGGRQWSRDELYEERVRRR